MRLSVIMKDLPLAIIVVDQWVVLTKNVGSGCVNASEVHRMFVGEISSSWTDSIDVPKQTCMLMH